VTTTLPRATPVRTRSDTDRRLRIAILVLTVIGIGIAAYLTYTHYAGIKVACLSSGGCETVQASRWSKVDGVPVALMGLIGYVLIFVSLGVPGDIGRIGAFGLTLVGFLFSAYLTYRELFSIHAICQWCVGSAVIMTVLLILTGWRVVRMDLGPPR
jgi:uncharacterized membrane protein